MTLKHTPQNDAQPSDEAKWVLVENRVLRIFSFAVFYLGQGLPIGLISIALPAWLAEQGADPSEIATFIAISALPLGFKMVAGPIMDRFSYLPMGRRRPWVVGAQLGLCIVITSFAFIPDPASNITLLTWAAFTVNVFAALQDVAVDGMAIDILPPTERGRANSFMAFGLIGGYAASGALTATLLSHFGLAAAASLLAIIASFIFVLSLRVRERHGEKLLPWTAGHETRRSFDLRMKSWGSIFSNLVRVIFLPASILLLLTTLFSRVAGGFWIVAAPVIAVQDLGYASASYSQWTAGAGLIAATIGLALGPLIDKSGAKLILMGSIIGLGLIFGVIALSEPLWHFAWFVLTILFIEATLVQFMFISSFVIHMSLCSVRVSATQFAIYMAWANLTRSIGAATYGEVESFLTSPQTFIAMAVMCFVAAGPLAVLRLGSHRKKIDEIDGISTKAD